MRRWLRLVGINLLVLVAALLAVNVLIAAGFGVVHGYKALFGRSEDRRAHLVNYQNHDWARRHFVEFKALATDYRSYYAWRRKPFEGETITVDASGKRVTPIEPTGPASLHVAFFGGSTMWGTGARDHETIPAFVARQDDAIRAQNFAESGWKAHQSLNALVESVAAGERHDVVLFYDGVNEVANGCRHELDPFSHGWEQPLRTVLARDGVLWLHLIRPMLHLAHVIGDEIGKLLHREAGIGSLFDCDRDPEKARAVARLLITDWLVAMDTTTRHGGRFLAVLQPVAYLSDTRKDALRLEREAELGRQYEAVYPLIREMAAAAAAAHGLVFHDASDLLDRDEHLYIDFSHVSPNGNELIASHLRSLIRDVGEPSRAGQE